MIRLLFFVLLTISLNEVLASKVTLCPVDWECNRFVQFLNVHEASIAILDESYEQYFSQLQLREIHVLVGEESPSDSLKISRQFARDKFSSAVMNFSEREESVILFVISTIHKMLKLHGLEVIANHPWKFIKIENWLCGGFAHTRGDYIILSQQHLDKLTVSWSGNMSSTDSLSLVRDLGSLLVHEQFHSLQRKYPDKFESLYVNDWGFIKTEVEGDSSIVINQLTNPDAPKPEWVVNYGGTYYWIRTLIDPNALEPKMGRDFIDVVLTLDVEGDKLYVAKDTCDKLIKQKLSNFKQYTALFSTNQGLDHPNEISAYMFSKYFIAILEGKKPFEKASKTTQMFSEKYISWLNNNF